MMKPWSWQMLYILMLHEPIVQRMHWFSYVVLPLEAERDKFQALWRQADDRAYEQQTKGSS